MESQLLPETISNQLNPDAYGFLEELCDITEIDQEKLYLRDTLAFFGAIDRMMPHKDNVINALKHMKTLPKRSFHQNIEMHHIIAEYGLLVLLLVIAIIAGVYFTGKPRPEDITWIFCPCNCRYSGNFSEK